LASTRTLRCTADDPGRYADAKARKNYSGMSPITKASGTNGSSWPGSHVIAVSATPCSCRHSRHSTIPPGARAFYEQQRARGATHYQALRSLANRLVAISSTAAYEPAPPTKNTSLGTRNQTNSAPQLDRSRSWDV
jgi:hypothetical protein